ncbi:hypothetical protein EDB92DRAFT_1950669 [Lactarius akahatsu]|uniref:Uncharacterized protein n=1 Tax=Lactarius akahatsu TaxID=416441 RepID=A0AAD4LEX7_9AGAM|nr:hypothetical protein EDB92DRAFT_1950669 [Lactarius akahatsu]
MTAIVDRIDSPADRIRDDEFLADKERFESFKLGGAPPAQSTRRHSHSRSHSRNLSISFSSSFHDISLSSSNSISSLSHPPAPTLSTTKRNSHHRRRSSVSTRRESAEVMGVTLPALSTSNSEDNVTLGDKDSIRRRALWALEGKPSPDGFSPVEIPELGSPEIERRISELPSKPSFPPVIGSFTSGLSGLANIRDSFSSRVTSSIKDQLHTLVEEEEEEEEPQASASPPADASLAIAPAGLTLRPLSLSPDRLMSTVTGEQLPTPDSAPTPTKPTGLKSLTLAASPSLTSPSSSPDSGVLSRATALHRRSVVVPPTHASSSASFFRRASLTESTSSISSDPFEAPRKRSSISYKPSFHGLPTPELTPTTEGRPLTGSETEWGRPPSLTNEQHFLYQSQAALVARISELERTLSFRTSRPVSLAASDSSSSVAEPTDEMLRLITDLKAERDELKRDIDGWRTRVADLEKQSGVLALRVDTERREAWIARERLSLLEVEKRAAVRAAEESDAAVKSLQAELTTTKADLQAAQEEAVRNQEIVHELECVRAELVGERRLREDLEKSLEELSLLKTPTPVAPIRRMMSIDSMSSATDVDSLDEHTMSGSELKAVQEVDEDEEVYSEHENNLMGYEDEEEGDDTFTSQNGSSFGSLEDIPCSTPHLDASVASSPSRSPSPAPLPTHARRSSLSREWSFPAKGAPHAASPQHFPEERTTSPFTKGFFGAASEEEDEMPPFVLPADVGVEVESPPAQDPACFSGSGLGVVLEEDELADAEDLFVGEEDEGGIKFKFEIPPTFVSSAQTPSPITPQTRKPVPFCELSSEDDDAAFTFPSASLVSRKTASPPSPSAIPRATVLKRFEGPARNVKPSPPRATPSPPAASSRNGSPLSDRSGGARPSFLPHPTVKPIAAPTFIPQPSSLTKVRVVPPPSIPRSPLRSQPPPSSAIAMSGSPFAALQNFANFVVPSWTITRGAVEENSIATTEETKIETEKKMGFVSKERQLARLRERMAEEGVVAVPCRRCVDRDVAP